MISIRYLIAGTRIIPTIREEDKRQRIRRLVWAEMVTTLGTTFAEEVVTGLVYLGITSVNSVEYSGLMIDGKRIVGMQVGFHVPFRR